MRKEKSENKEVEKDSWSSTINAHEHWIFQSYSSPDHHILDKCKDPIDFCCLFLNDKVINCIIAETN